MPDNEKKLQERKTQEFLDTVDSLPERDIEEDREAFKEMLTLMVKRFQKENIMEDQVETVLELIEADPVKYRSYSVKQYYTLRHCLSMKYNQEVSTTLTDVIFYYSIYKAVLDKVITKIEGSTCCADKTAHLLRVYIAQQLGKEISDEDRDVDCYWVPGTVQIEDWLELIDGIYKNNVGCVDKYLIIYGQFLMKVEKAYK